MASFFSFRTKCRLHILVIAVGSHGVPSGLHTGNIYIYKRVHARTKSNQHVTLQTTFCSRTHFTRRTARIQRFRRSTSYGFQGNQ